MVVHLLLKGSMTQPVRPHHPPLSCGTDDVTGLVPRSFEQKRVMQISRLYCSNRCSHYCQPLIFRKPSKTFKRFWSGSSRPWAMPRKIKCTFTSFPASSVASSYRLRLKRPSDSENLRVLACQGLATKRPSKSGLKFRNFGNYKILFYFCFK